jgi:hypothetical protein
MSNRGHRGIELSTRDAVARSNDRSATVTNENHASAQPVSAAATAPTGASGEPAMVGVADPPGGRTAGTTPTRTTPTRTTPTRTTPVASAPAGPTGSAPDRPTGSLPVDRVPRAPAGRLGVAGLLAALVGAFGAIVPFAAPGLGYSADGAPSWYWDLPHVVLWLVPGTGAFLAGAVVLLFLRPTRRGGGRVADTSAGTLMMVCGAWFVIGPLAWPVLRNAAGVYVPASPLRELGYQTGYSLGPGAMLLLLGGLVAGWGLRGQPGPRHGAHRAARSIVT